MATTDPENKGTTAAAAPQTFKTKDLASWRTAYQASQPQPLLVHLNGDTTWLLQVPVPAHHRSQDHQQQQQQDEDSQPQPIASSSPPPPPLTEKKKSRSHFNILIDPWLQGPQSDVASWFSTQWHVVAPSVQTIAELQTTLRQLEEEEEGKGDDDHDDTTPEDAQAGTAESYIDAVAISHEFTDHCHEATLRELPRSTPVFATDKAADLIRGWRYFDTVVTTPGYSFSSASASASASPPPAAAPHQKQPEDWHKVLSVAPLPAWLGIGRVVTPGNALYYHSAIAIVFDRAAASPSPTSPPHASSAPASPSASTQGASAEAEAVLYSPHGIQPSDLSALASPDCRVKTLALMHGLHDVKIWMAKQLNLGAHNGLASARACGARYWVATHDEVKSGGGVLAPFLRRLQWSVADAVAGMGGGGGGGGGEDGVGGKQKKNKNKNKKGGKGEESAKEPVAAVEGAAERDGYEFVELGSGDGLVLAR